MGVTFYSFCLLTLQTSTNYGHFFETVYELVCWPETCGKLFKQEFDLNGKVFSRLDNRQFLIPLRFPWTPGANGNSA